MNTPEHSRSPEPSSATDPPPADPPPADPPPAEPMSGEPLCSEPVCSERLESLILRDDRIVETVAKLQVRIHERFPNSGLSRLCGHLHQVACQAAERSVWIGRPILWIRAVGYLLAFSLLALLIAFGRMAVRLDTHALTSLEFIQTFEPAVNGLVFVCIAIYFLISLEKRIKRRRALAAVHELRSLAHIIDMHQLTKDPERILGNWQATDNSPKASMTPFQLGRYLDYCSEMLSLIGKIAALYVERFDDGVSVAAVTEIEQLSAGLSRKIWQKIIILNQSRERF
ncbi:hypothetical protein [Novipirellula artificiosorum]|uniref:Uncharacterized protein n=1 Tax=Novipirellula artificiosorum TaxID=2528016 RepID=A0A5C6E0Q5_9BACT|nr:hypothetical protein [Novipirellula artificiosorum]TWU40749.1 hypothetical protein Poly41_15840 [Novipirellula artificiosorum]